MRIPKPPLQQREHRAKMGQEQAEVLGISALSHIAADPERLERFLAVTGLNPAGLRNVSANPGFVSGVLDYVCSDESLLLGFAAEQGVKPETVAAAQRLLAGPAGEDW